MYHDQMTRRLVYLWVLVVPVLFARADGPSEADDYRTLQTAHVQPDGTGAVRYFRQRLGGTADTEEIKRLIRLLGDNVFAVREARPKT